MKGPFFAGAALCLAPLVVERAPWAAPGALLLGIAVAMTAGNPYPAESKKWSALLLRGSVILLGLKLPFGEVARAGARGLGLALVTIVGTFGLGRVVGSWLKVRPNAALLVSAGTAICGGSAIAAVAGATDADGEDVAVAAGTVFLFNAAALLLFPVLGHALGLSPATFGEWAGVAIHDVASVVGAATAFDPASLTTATATKLSRVLYLVPIVFVIAWSRKKSGGAGAFPWFVLGFLAAAGARSAFPDLARIAPLVEQVSSAGFALSLYLIGAGLSRSALAKVGWRPFALGLALWVAISVVSLLALR